MAGKRCFGCMNIKTSSPVCEHCGYNEFANNESHQLPCGTVLQGQYLVGKVLGQGGFGITYLGWDQYLNIPVAIKEFYPSGFVNRDCSFSLSLTSYETATNEAFQSTRARFLREAQTLARLSGVEEVVHVRNFFEVNNTAYIIMEYVQGIDLRRYINLRGGRLTAQETLGIMNPILRALIQVHAAGVVHRDISPDNIMMQSGGGAKLLDFGAVRNVEVSDADAQLPKSTEAILKHGFAPIEQYQRRGAIGPWTDEYALCATMYYCMTGRIPADAPERMMEDIQINWASIPGLTAEQIAALDKGMAVRAKDRFASVQELYNALYHQHSVWTDYSTQPQQTQYSQIQQPQPAPQPQPVPQPEPVPQQKPQPEPQIKHDPPRKKPGLLIPVAAAALAAVVLFGALGKGGEKKEEGAGTSLPGQSAASSQPERREKKDLIHTFSNGAQQETKVDANGFEVERILRDGAGQQIRRYTAEYNDDGDMICMTTYDENDQEVFREEWDYSAPGVDTEYRVFENGALESKYTYEYDSSGNIIYSIRYNGSGKQTNQTTYEREYDAFGNQTASTTKYDDGSYAKLEYDSDGNAIRYESYDENGKLTYASDRVYDGDGNMTQFTNYNAQGGVSNVCNTSYDAWGNETRREYCDTDGNVEFSYDYLYDANGVQVGYTYRSYTYTSTTDYEEMRAIDGTLAHQFWQGNSGYGGETWYHFSGSQDRSESFDASGNRYAHNEYHYDEDEQLLGYTNYYTSSYDGTTTVTVYDENYRITDEKSYDSNGNLCGWGDNFYDDNGNLVEEIDYLADGTVEYHRETVFDENGRQTESSYTSYDEDGRLSYVSIDRYDSNGRLESGKSMHYRDGVLNSTSEYEYDSGRMVKCMNYDASGKLNDWYVNEYNAQGQNHKTTYYDASGNMNRWVEREFNDQGKEVKSTCYNADGSLSYWSKTIYDENGNYVDTEYSWE